MNTPLILASMAAVQRAILDNESQIESLDRAIGDGDHYINVRRGCEAAMSLRAELARVEPGAALQKIGMKLMSTVGGASGPLLGSFFIAMGKSVGSGAQASRADVAVAFAAGVEAIKSRGKADVGEKTMLDVLIPVSRLLSRRAADDAALPALCDELKDEARRNMLATKDMIATKGRAHFLGERALGHVDPGCKTCEVAIGAVCDTVTAAKETA
jgi:dihydroxyacetone kinase-like protein